MFMQVKVLQYHEPDLSDLVSIEAVTKMCILKLYCTVTISVTKFFRVESELVSLRGCKDTVFCLCLVSGIERVEDKIISISSFHVHEVK
jgi:hypothetical protein